MATLSDLVSVLAKTTGLPPATVFAYGRFAREAGLISQKGHGRGAAQMTPTDAANLLIAVAGTGVAKEAGAAIKAFRSLDDAIVLGGGVGDSPGRLLIKEWLSGVGPIEEVPPTQLAPGAVPPHRLKCTFGALVTFLIEKAANSDFLEFLRTAAILDTPKFQEDAEVVFNITFDRGTRSARVSFWHPFIWREIFEIDFHSGRSENDLIITAQIGSEIIAALGHCLAGRPFPSRRVVRRLRMLPLRSKSTKERSRLRR
jgi:hypothetical protein